MSPGSSRTATQQKRGGAQKKAKKGQKKQEFQEQDNYDSAEKGTITGLRELQGDAIEFLRRGQLNKLIKSMSLIIQEKEKVDHQIKLSWSDEFWLGFLCIYTGFMEGMIPFPLLRKRKVGFTAIPVIGNSVQMFFSPIIMVGIPKWIRCPPSVMRGLWWSWFTLTLTAYVQYEPFEKSS